MEITINGQPITALDITTDEGGITMRLSRLGLGLGVLPTVSGLVPMPPIAPLAFYDLSGPTYMTLDGSNNVTGVTDRSGNDHHIVTTTDNPRYTPPIDHMLGAVDFGVNQGYMTIPATVSLSRANATVIMVSRKTAGYAQRASQCMMSLQSGNTLPLVHRNTGFFETMSANTYRIASVIGPLGQTTTNFAILGAAAVTMGVDDINENVTPNGDFTVTGGFIGRHTTSAFHYDGDLAAVLIYASALTVAQVTEIRTYLATYFGAPAPGAYSLHLAGDSITAGTGADIHGTTDNSYYAWPGQLFGLYGGTDRPQVINRGVASAIIDVNSTVIRSNLRNTNIAATRKRVLVYGWGANDLALGDSAATVISNMNTTMANIRATYSDLHIGVSTVTNASRFTDDMNAQLALYNAEVRNPATMTHDFHIDMGGISQMADPTSTSYNTDELHPTVLGYSYMAAEAKSKIDAYLATL
jgi:lysophospholipase L1-like esterase